MWIKMLVQQHFYKREDGMPFFCQIRITRNTSQIGDLSVVFRYKKPLLSSFIPGWHKFFDCMWYGQQTDNSWPAVYKLYSINQTFKFFDFNFGDSEKKGSSKSLILRIPIFTKLGRYHFQRKQKYNTKVKKMKLEVSFFKKVVYLNSSSSSSYSSKF